MPDSERPDFELTPPPLVPPKHGIEREEWEARFRERFKVVLKWTDAELVGIIDGELESWPVTDDDWLFELPEDAANDNLSCWSE